MRSTNLALALLWECFCQDQKGKNPDLTLTLLLGIVYMLYMTSRMTVPKLKYQNTTFIQIYKSSNGTLYRKIRVHGQIKVQIKCLRT